MTESSTLQGLKQNQLLKTENLDFIPELQSEPTTEQIGNESEFRVNLETHPWENPEFKDDSNVKSYRDLATQYVVSEDTIRKDLKKIANIHEDFGAHYQLTRKQGRKILVTAEGQCELCKYRYLGSDSYRHDIEAFWGTVEPEPEMVDEDEWDENEKSTSSSALTVPKAPSSLSRFSQWEKAEQEALQSAQSKLNSQSW